MILSVLCWKYPNVKHQRNTIFKHLYRLVWDMYFFFFVSEAVLFSAVGNTPAN